MRLSRLGFLLVLLSVAKSASAQVPAAPAAEPAQPPAVAAPAQPAPEPAPAPAPAPTPPPETPPPPAEPPSAPPPEAAPVPEKTPESAPAPVTPPPPQGPAPEVAAEVPAAPAAPPWIRAHSPLTLEGRLGVLLRPESSAGFQDETHTGAELGLSLYMDFASSLAAGIEIERASLGRGRSLSGLDSVSIDYTVSSAMLGFRAYPMRSALVDVFIGLQVGVGIQAVSAAGTTNNGGLLPPSSYTCGATDTPAFQLGGGIGARLMLSPRWGITARVNGTGRRLSSDVVDQCAQGLGTATTVSGSLGLGYDFDLE